MFTDYCMHECMQPRVHVLLTQCKHELIKISSICILSYYVSSERNTTHTYLTLPTGPVLTHKATTYGGSSGAPLFKVVQGEPVAVALHCGCVPPTGPPLLNFSFLISHVLHHVLYGTFKEGRLLHLGLDGFPVSCTASFHLCHSGTCSEGDRPSQYIIGYWSTLLDSYHHGSLPKSLKHVSSLLLM